MEKKLIAPLRIDLAGGWIDLPDFAEIYPGYVVNVAIKPYISLNKRKINFGDYKPKGGIASSTGAIILTSLKQIITHSLNNKVYCSPAKFAESIFKWENYMINFKIGRQDQYAIALGGLNCLRFGKDDFHANDFDVEMHVSEKTPEISKLERSLVLVHSGTNREAQSIVKIVRRNVASKEKKYLDALRDIAKAGEKVARAVQEKRIEDLAEIMSENWDAQKRFAPEATTKEIDYIYSEMLKNGVLGGKLCGAGGGGYFVFYCKDREKVKRKAEEMGLQVIIPKFEMKDILNLNNLNPENENRRQNIES